MVTENCENCKTPVVKVYLYGHGKVVHCNKLNVDYVDYNYVSDKRWLKKAIECLEGCELELSDKLSYYEVINTDKKNTHENNTISFCPTLGIVTVYVNTEDMANSKSVILRDKITGINYEMKTNKTHKLVANFMKENGICED